MFLCLLFACVILISSRSSRAYSVFSDDPVSFFSPFQDIDSPWLDDHRMFDLDDFDDPMHDADDQGDDKDLRQEKAMDADALSPISFPRDDSGPALVSRSAACRSTQCSAEVIQSGDPDDRSVTDLSYDMADTLSSASVDGVDFEPLQDDDDQFEVCCICSYPCYSLPTSTGL